MRERPLRVIRLALSSTGGRRVLEDALAVRNAVFGEEERLLTRPDRDEYDELPSAQHLVVYVNDEPAAAARLLFPNTRIARATGGYYGIALEHLVDLSPLRSAGLIPAESGRVSVLKRHRNSEVIIWLLAGIYWASRNTGINAWVAAVNLETDVASHARLVERTVSARKLASHLLVTSLAPSAPPPHPSVRFYKAKHWELARQWRFHELPLPRALRLFTERMAARGMGPPLYLPEFARYALPVCARLSDVPRESLERFEALEQQAHHAP